MLPVFQTFFKKFEVPASASLVERTELDDFALDIVGRDETQATETTFFRIKETVHFTYNIRFGE